MIFIIMVVVFAKNICYAATAEVIFPANITAAMFLANITAAIIFPASLLHPFIHVKLLWQPLIIIKPVCALNSLITRVHYLICFRRLIHYTPYQNTHCLTRSHVLGAGHGIWVIHSHCRTWSFSISFCKTAKIHITYSI